MKLRISLGRNLGFGRNPTLINLLIQVIFTTAEIVIGDCGGSWGGFTFDREMDHGTGFPELVVKESKGPRVIPT